MHRAAHSKFEFCVLAVLLAFSFTTLSCPRAEGGQTVTLFVDDFKANKEKNLLDGMSSAWSCNPYDPTVQCSSSFVDVIRDGRETSVLKLRYGLTDPKYITYYYSETQARYKNNSIAIDPAALSETKARTKAIDVQTLRYYQGRLQQGYAAAKAAAKNKSPSLLKNYNNYLQSFHKYDYSKYIPGSSNIDYSKYYKKPDYSKYINGTTTINYSKYYAKSIADSDIDYSKYYVKPDYSKYIKTSGAVDYSKYYAGQVGPDGRTKQYIGLKFRIGGDVDYNGYYTKLNGLDLRPYQYLTFWVKRGEEAYPDSFKIELKCGPYLATYRYSFPTSGDQWIHASIPLTDFTNFDSEKWDRASEMTIVFEGGHTKPVSGVLYLDDIGFSADTEYFQRQNTLIEEKTEKTREEMRRISALPEDELLDIIERKTFDYFWLEASPNTGLTKDRSMVYGAASTGAVGFGLTAMCIGAERKWITQKEAYDRVYKTLKALRDVVAKEHGFFCHWINGRTGERDGRSEYSSVDTSLLIGGVLTAREYFPQPEIKQLADEIYQNLDWPWMLDDNPESGLLSMGWDPEKKFKGYIKWDMFAEDLMMYLLAIGSPTHPLPEKSWDSFRRPVKEYGGQTYLYHEGESMFVYTYSHAWVDFRDKHDAYADYWKNSIAAIRANYERCKEYASNFKTYKEGYWGISASDGPDGYSAFGATAVLGMNNGTIPPYSLCAAVPFAPELAIPAIRSLLANYGDKVWGRYGFVSAFNLDRNWFSTEYIGIDEGDILLMLENYRTGFVWKTFMKNPYIKRGMEVAGFQPGTKELDVAFLKKMEDERAKELEKTGGSIVKKLTIARSKKKIDVDGTLQQWDKGIFEKYDAGKDLESGKISGPADLAGAFGFQWDDENLYFAIDVTDDEIVAREKQKEIYKGDCVEIYLDFITQGKNFIWGDKKNFQIGLAPDCATGSPAAYAWFQDIDPKENVKLAVKKTGTGYRMEAAIKWSFLQQNPQPGMVFGLSVALHDIDSGGKEKKLNWYFKQQPGRIKLGEAVLGE